MATLQVVVTFAWWLRPYLHALCFFAAITGSEPDMRKLMVVIDRAMRLKVV